MRPILARAALGLVVAVVILAAVEVVLRLLLGPAAGPRLMRTVWDPSQAPFSVSGDLVTPSYQAQDAIPAFPAQPPAGRIRLMVFGESSVHAGSQLPLAQEFPQVLERKLQARGLPVDVLNMGRPGLDSNTLKYIVEASIPWKPQVAVIYTGHNDIGNSYMFAAYHDVGSRWEAQIRLTLDRLQLYTQLRNLVLPRTPEWLIPMPSMANQVAALTPAQRWMIDENFRRNLAFVVRMLQEAGVRVVLSTVGSRLDQWEVDVSTCPEVMPAMAWSGGGGRTQFMPHLLTPRDVEAAIAARPDCPEAWFADGVMRAARGDAAGARASYVRARDLDRIPLRAPSSLVQVIRDVAAEAGVPLADFDAWLAGYSAADTAIYFTDALHLSATGHLQVAALLEPLVATEVEAALAAN